jgi:hypothetical protein
MLVLNYIHLTDLGGLEFDSTGSVQAVEEIYEYKENETSPRKKRKDESFDLEVKKQKEELARLLKECEKAQSDYDTLTSKSEEETIAAERDKRKRLEELEIEDRKRRKDSEKIKKDRAKLEEEKRLLEQQQKIVHDQQSNSKQIEHEKATFENKLRIMQAKLDDLESENRNLTKTHEERLAEERKNAQQVSSQLQSQIEQFKSTSDHMDTEIKRLLAAKSESDEKAKKSQEELNLIKNLFDQSKSESQKTKEELAKSMTLREEEKSKAENMKIEFEKKLKAERETFETTLKNRDSLSHQQLVTEFETRYSDLKQRHSQDFENQRASYENLLHVRDQTIQEVKDQHERARTENREQQEQLQEKIQNLEELLSRSQEQQQLMNERQQQEIAEKQAKQKELEQSLDEHKQQYSAQVKDHEQILERINAQHANAIQDYEKNRIDLEEKIASTRQHFEKELASRDQLVQQYQKLHEDDKNQIEAESKEQQDELQEKIQNLERLLSRSQEQQQLTNERHEQDVLDKVARQKELEESLESYKQQHVANIKDHERILENVHAHYAKIIQEHDKNRTDLEERTVNARQNFEKELTSRDQLVQQYQKLHEDDKNRIEAAEQKCKLLLDEQAEYQEQHSSKLKELERSLETQRKAFEKRLEQADERYELIIHEKDELVQNGIQQDKAIAALERRLNESITERERLESSRVDIVNVVQQAQQSLSDKEQAHHELYLKIESLTAKLEQQISLNSQLKTDLSQHIDELRSQKNDALSSISNLQEQNQKQHIDLDEKDKIIQALRSEKEAKEEEEQRKLEEEQEEERKRLEEEQKEEEERILRELEDQKRREETTSPRSPTDDDETIVLEIEKELGQNLSEEVKKDIREMKEKLATLRRSAKKITTKQIGEMSNYKSPPDAVFRAARSVGLILDYTASSLRNWEGCRKVLKDNFKKQITAYDPTTVQDATKFRLARKELEGLDYNICCQKGSIPAGVMYNFVSITLQLRERAMHLRGMNKQQHQQILDEYANEVTAMLKGV